MADSKITDLTADTSPTTDDLVPTVNDPGGTPANRKVTVGNLISAGAYTELGRTTLGSAGDSISVSITAKKYLMIVGHILSTGGTTVAGLRFNADTGNNYNYRYSTDGGADTATGTTSILALSSGTNGHKLVEAKIINVAAQEKMAIGQTVSHNATGVGNVVDKWEASGKWVNTTDQITTVALTNSGSGDFDTGSELVVYGRD